MSAISIIGLGKLGQPLALAYAYRGFRVIGVDLDMNKVQTMNEKTLSIINRLGEGIIHKIPSDGFSATTDIEQAVMESDATIIMVNTPQTIDSPLSLEYVMPACRDLGKALRKKEDYHLVVLSSTVFPIATEGIVKPILEINSDKQCGLDFGLCYFPEFLALGSEISNILRPDFLLIGEYDTKSGDTLLEILLHLCENNPPVIRTNLVNAELAKMALNSFLITKIFFANHWAEICEEYPGADIDCLTSVLGLDKRISPRFLTGSAGGIEGPCFPRDVKAWLRLTDYAGVSPAFPSTMEDATYMGASRLVKIIRMKVDRGSTIGILGLSYKPNVPLAIDSLGLQLVKLLKLHGFAVIAYDPVRCGITDILTARSLEECIEQADCLVITTAWKEFKRLEQYKDKIIIDCWRMLSNMGENYIAIGRGK